MQNDYYYDETSRNFNFPNDAFPKCENKEIRDMSSMKKNNFSDNCEKQNLKHKPCRNLNEEINNKIKSLIKQSKIISNEIDCLSDIFNELIDLFNEKECLSMKEKASLRDIKNDICLLSSVLNYMKLDIKSLIKCI